MLYDINNNEKNIILIIIFYFKLAGTFCKKKQLAWWNYIISQVGVLWK